MTDVPEPAVIACTLGAEGMRERVKWIADLNRTALRSQRRSGLQLELTYARSALERVREMVAREQRCCAFLSFTVSEEHDAVRLIIEAPVASHEVIDSIFGPFEAGVPASSGCGCSSSKCC
ncbi:MAG: hypothetical protein ACREUT_11480 [Steroidobacteraceae bacterium]